MTLENCKNLRAIDCFYLLRDSYFELCPKFKTYLCLMGLGTVDGLISFVNDKQTMMTLLKKVKLEGRKKQCRITETKDLLILERNYLSTILRHPGLKEIEKKSKKQSYQNRYIDRKNYDLDRARVEIKSRLSEIHSIYRQKKQLQYNRNSQTPVTPPPYKPITREPPSVMLSRKRRSNIPPSASQPDQPA